MAATILAEQARGISFLFYPIVSFIGTYVKLMPCASFTSAIDE